MVVGRRGTTTSSIHDTGSNQCGSPKLPSMDGLIKGVLSNLFSSAMEISSVNGSSVICLNSSGVKYFFSDHNLMTFLSGSFCASWADRIVFTRAGRYCNAAEGT